MHNNEETLQAIRTKCQEVLLKWDILHTEEETKTVVVSNPNSKVSVKAEVSEEDGIVYSVIYRITDQTSIIRPKKANVIFYSDGDLHCEYTAFESEEDILKSLNK